MYLNLSFVTPEAPPPADEDALLVASARAGDRAAFDTLVRRHEQKILQLAKRITRSQDDAEEVAQDAFLQAFVHLEGFNDEARFSTWLTRIAVNQALMLLRKRHRRSREVRLDHNAGSDDAPIRREFHDRRENPEQNYSQREMLRILGQALAELSPNLRSAVELRDLEERTTEETTRALGVSVSAVKSRLLRARSRLRQALDPHLQHRGNQAVGVRWR